MAAEGRRRDRGSVREKCSGDSGGGRGGRGGAGSGLAVVRG